MDYAIQLELADRIELFAVFESCLPTQISTIEATIAQGLHFH